MPETTTYKLIESIEDLSLAKFLDCICEQKLSVLCKGEADDVTLLECWSNLYSQYLDILGDTETLYLLSLQKDCEVLNLKIIATEAIVKLLHQVYSSELVKNLKSFGWDVRLITEGSPHYTHSLHKITGRLAHLKLKLQEKQKELLNYYADHANDTIARQFYDTQISRVGKFQGYPINRKKTMMPEYIAILKDYLSQFKPKEDGSAER